MLCGIVEVYYCSKKEKMKSHRYMLLCLLLLIVSIPLSAQQRPSPNDPGGTRGLDTIINGGFETDSDWIETSLTFPNDLICGAACGNGGGTAGPNTGTGFGWLGGGSQESSRLSQSLTLTPVVGTTDVLSFYLWNGTTTRGSDRFYTRSNGLQLLEVIEGNLRFTSGYSQVLLNLTGMGSGDVTFMSTSVDGSITNFSLDDVSVITDVEDIVANGSFEDVTPLLRWRTLGASEDSVLCNIASPNSAVFGNCYYHFKGSATENSRLRQTVNLPSIDTLPLGSTLLGSFWANVEPGVTLTANITLTYNNGRTITYSLDASYNPVFDDPAARNNDSNREWKLYQFPPIVLTRNISAAPVINITHTSNKPRFVSLVDNISMAYLPPAP